MFENIVSRNIPYLIKYVNLYTQEAQRTPGRINSKRSTARSITVRLSKAKVAALLYSPTSNASVLISLVNVPPLYCSHSSECRVMPHSLKFISLVTNDVEHFLMH